MTIRYVTETALNDSDKTITVESNRQWAFLGGMAELATTATVGNRQVDLVIGDGTDDLITIPANAVQAASLTRQYEYIQGEAAPSALALLRISIDVAIHFSSLK